MSLIIPAEWKSFVLIHSYDDDGVVRYSASCGHPRLSGFEQPSVDLLQKARVFIDGMERSIYGPDATWIRSYSSYLCDRKSAGVTFSAR